MVKILLAGVLLGIPVIGLVVVVRLAWWGYQSVRAGSVRLAVLSALAILVLAALFVAVVFVWFGYGVAHSKKDVWTDLMVVLLTCVPFYATCYGLWRTARHFQSVLRGAGRPQAP